MCIKKFRIVSQIFFFILFCLLLFVLVSYPLAYAFNTRWFLRLNPLNSLLTFIAARSLPVTCVITGLAVAIGTVALGRVFCGFFCPLGAMIDFSDKFFFKSISFSHIRPPQFLQKLKYILLFALIILALAGATIPWFIDPLSLSTRIMTLLVYPIPAIVTFTLQPLAGFSSSGAKLHVPFFYGGLATGAVLAGILTLSIWDRRFWCQYVCPSGALFGLLSVRPFYRRNTSKTCGGCSACVKTCPTRAIHKTDFSATSTAECILCGRCVEIKKDCSSFRFGASAQFSSRARGADIGRRQLIAGAASGMLMLPIVKADAMVRRDNTGRLIRPPGALPEALFNARCLACGQCMKVCPTNTLQPCTLSDGFSRLSTPKVVPRIGGCEEKCYLCGHVCPTSAIRKLEYEEKRFVKIGTAVIDRHRCLAWEQKKECLVCDEVCPYNAIESKIVDTVKGPFKVPIIDESLCIGCGMCEQQCPIFDTAAIVVYKFGENRRAKGAYVNEAQKQMILEQRGRSDSAHATNFGEEPSAVKPEAKPEAGSKPPASGTGNVPSSGFSF